MYADIIGESPGRTEERMIECHGDHAASLGYSLTSPYSPHVMRTLVTLKQNLGAERFQKLLDQNFQGDGAAMARAALPGRALAAYLTGPDKPQASRGYSMKSPYSPHVMATMIKLKRNLGAEKFQKILDFNFKGNAAAMARATQPGRALSAWVSGR